jgi:hypothetical protein
LSSVTTSLDTVDPRHCAFSSAVRAPTMLLTRHHLIDERPLEDCVCLEEPPSSTKGLSAELRTAPVRQYDVLEAPFIVNVSFFGQRDDHYCLQVYIQSDEKEQSRTSLENAIPSKNRPLTIPVPVQTTHRLTPCLFTALYNHLLRMSIQASTEMSLNPTSVASVSPSTQSPAKVEPLN